MDLSAILSWLVGPGVGVFISYVLDQWSPWHDWKPDDKLGFDPKATIVTAGSLLIGLGAYGFVTNVAPSTIDQLNPIVKAAFPFFAWLVPQLFHAFVNKKLTSTTITATTQDGGTVSATATSAEPSTGDTG